MGFRKTFAKSMLISGGYSYASQAISFFSTTIISRFLSPDSYGFVGIITIFTGFLSIFSDSGISLAVIRTDYRNTFYRSLNNLAMLIGIILCLLMCLLAYPIALYFRNTELFIPILAMSSVFIIKSTTLVRGALLSKEMQFGFAGRTNLVTTIAGVVLTIALAYWGAGYWSLIIPQILTGVIYLFIVEHRVKLGFKIYSPAHIKAAFKHTKKIIGNLMGFNIINYWARNADNLIVGRFYGAHDLGIYARAYNFLTMPLSLITGLIGNVLYPSLNKIKDSGDAVRKEYFFILKMITFISYPISFLLVMFPHKIVFLLWGKTWMEVATILPYFGLLVFSQSLLSTVGNILVLVKKEETLRNSGWVGAVAMIGAIAFGARYSIEAIARYYALAFILIVLPFNMVYIYIHALKFDAKKILLFWCPIIVCSFTIWLGCYLNGNVLKIAGLIVLFLFMVITVLSEIKKLLTSKPVFSGVRRI